MSESLRDLVVTLSLNSDNFTRNIKSISSIIREAQSEFDLAAAGTDNFEKSLDGMKAKSASLNKQIELQNKLVQQNHRAYQKSQSVLAKSIRGNDNLKVSLDEAKRKYDEIQDEVKRFTKVYKEAVNVMGQETADQLFGDSLEDLKKQASDAQKEVDTLSKKLKVSDRTVRNNADAVTRNGTAYNKARANLKSMREELSKVDKQIATQSSKWYAASQSLEQFSKTADKVAKTTGKIGTVLSVGLTNPIVAAGKSVLKSSIDYESAFTSVQKTVDATEGEFAELSSQIKQMSTEIATDATDIAETFAIAGQMGIEADNLAEFARVMIDLGNSTDIVATDAASSLSQFRNITGMASDDFDRLGSTLVDLGNNFATTESKIMDMSLRLAGAGAQIGLSEPEILAFATALSSVGIEAEMGGSALSKALIKMEVASETGGQALDDFAKVAGVSSEAFATMWKNDPTGAFMGFLKGLADMDEQGMSAIATLDEIGIAEVRLRDTLLRSTNAVDLMSEAQARANQAWDENVALSNEANRRYGTTESKIKNLRNNFVNFARQLGDDVNPELNSLIDKADSFVDGLNNMSLSQREFVVKTAGVAAAAGPAMLGISGISKALSGAAKLFAPFASAAAAAGGGLSGFATALTTTPIGIAALVAALGIGGAAFIDYASGAKKARDAVNGLRDTADEWQRTQAKTLYDNEGLKAFGLSSDTFKQGEKDFTSGAKEWMEGVLTVWSDGKRESQKDVKGWIDNFKELNTGVRDELTSMQESAEKYGYSGVSASLQTDIDTLNSMDKEISKLLNNRRNRKLSEKDQIRLNELINQREAIVIKYRLEEETGKSGYQAILDQLNKDEAKAAATGTTVTTERYGEALKATAEGFKTVRSELDAWYDAEYDVVQLIEDETQREEARVALDKKYNAERTKAAQEYAGVLKQITPEIMSSDQMKSAAEGIDQITAKVAQLSTAVGGDKQQERATILSEIDTLTSNLDEGALTSYYTTLTQIQSLYKDFGMDQGEVNSMFGMDVESELTQLASLQTTLNNTGTELEGLKSMLGESLVAEMEPILVELNMDNAVATWTAFANNPGAITATVDSYDDSGAPALTPTASVSVTGWDLKAFNAYMALNPTKINGVLRVKDFPGDASGLLKQDGTRVFDENGVEIPITPEVTKQITKNDLVVLNESGTIDIIITPKVEGTIDSVERIREALTGKGRENTATENAPVLGDAFEGDFWDRLGGVAEYAQEVAESMDNTFGIINNIRFTALQSRLNNGFSAEEVAGLQTYVQEVVTAIQNGEAVSEEDVNNLQTVLDLVSALDTTGVGENITGGIAEAMSATSWDETATTVGSNIVTALCTALGIQSPSTVARDQVGTFVAEGVAEGMTSYSFASAGQTMGQNAINSAKSALTFSVGASIGRNFGNGIASGIRAAMPTIMAAAGDAAGAGVNAAKAELAINSPSRKTHDEIGVMFSRGIADGVWDEAEKQSKVIANAAKYITDSAAGVVAGSTYNNQRSYNNSSSVNLTVENLHVRDDQDVRALAIEIASLVKRQNVGRGAQVTLKG